MRKLEMCSVWPLGHCDSASAAGGWWTQRTSWGTSSQTRCPRRSVTGWRPLSHVRGLWWCAALKTSHVSAASSTQCRPASLWRGSADCLKATVWDYMVLYLLLIVLCLPCVVTGCTDEPPTWLGSVILQMWSLCSRSVNRFIYWCVRHVIKYPPADETCLCLLQHVDMWSFDVFALNDASGDHALKFVFYELLTRYDLINRFKVQTMNKPLQISAIYEISHFLGSGKGDVCCMCCLVRSLFLLSYRFWTCWRWATVNTRTRTTTWCMLQMSHRPFITCFSRLAWW